MKIVVNGQQAFGSAVLEALLARGEQVVAVYCAPDAPGSKPDPLKEAALEAGLPVYQPKSFKSSEVLAAFLALKPDLCVMAYVTKIIPEAFLHAPTHGTIQYHPSLLPRHRGPSSINWPIIQGETRTGLSIFWPDARLDTGPILLQKEVEITATDTLGSVYFDKLFPLGVEAMLEGVDLVRAGNAPRTPQDETKATYEGWCEKKDVQVDWNRPAAETGNLVRGTNPQPGAWTTCQKLGLKTLSIFDCLAKPEKAIPPDFAPGQVVALTEKGFSVATTQGVLEIFRVRVEGEGKVSAAEFAKSLGLQPGDFLK